LHYTILLMQTWLLFILCGLILIFQKNRNKRATASTLLC
jgi:hypothetical protein